MRSPGGLHHGQFSIVDQFIAKQKKRRSWEGKGIQFGSGTGLSSVIVTYNSSMTCKWFLFMNEMPSSFSLNVLTMDLKDFLMLIVALPFSFHYTSCNYLFKKSTDITKPHWKFNKVIFFIVFLSLRF